MLLESAAALVPGEIVANSPCSNAVFKVFLCDRSWFADGVPARGLRFFDVTQRTRSTVNPLTCNPHITHQTSSIRVKAFCVMLLCITSVCSAQNTPAVYKPSSMFPSTTVQQAGRIQPLQRLNNGRRGSNDIVPPSTQFTPAANEPQEAIDASDLDGKLIKSIEFKGHKFMTEQRLMATINSRTDRSFDSGLLQEDVRNLYRTGLIRDVRVVTDRVDDGVCIEFEVFERPTIRSLRFIGNRGILDEKLSTEAGLAAGDALNQ